MALMPILRKGSCFQASKHSMTNHPSKEPKNPRLEFNRLMVEKLQDHILEQVERFAEEHPDCDRAAYPVAVGQAFVGQCLKTYGVEGFEQARQHATLIIDAVEHAYRGS
jgi:hypothetical protein